MSDMAEQSNLEPMEQPVVDPPSRKRESTEPIKCSDVKKPVTEETKIIKMELESSEADNNVPESGSSIGDDEAGMSAQNKLALELLDDINTCAREVLIKIQDEIEKAFKKHE